MDYRSSQWSGGVTRELFIYPEWTAYPDRDFLLRISAATVVLETATFTPLEGFHRWITPLEGRLVLQGDQGTAASLAPYEIHDFDGSEGIESRGKVSDFNLMVKKGWEADMRVLALEAGEAMTLALEASDLLALYLPEGETLTLGGIPQGSLKAGELLVAEGGGTLDLQTEAPSRVICCRVKKARASEG
jgi:environmental stress-induced protein Ves